MSDYFKFMGKPFSYWATVEDERDEARAIAGELARYIRAQEVAVRAPIKDVKWRLDEEVTAWRAIRPGVRKWLEK